MKIPPLPKLPRKSTAKIDQAILRDEKILENFRVIQSAYLQKAFDLALYLLTIASAFLGFIAMRTGGTSEIIYVTIGIAIILSLLNTRDLFQRFPDVLLALWRQKLFSSPTEYHSKSETDSPRGDEYLLNFFGETKDLLHHNFASGLFGFIGFAVIGWAVWVLDGDWLTHIGALFQSIPLVVIFTLLPRLIFLFAGVICGMMGWRVLVIARQIAALGSTFDVNLQINHPDGCAGLSPIGDLCLILTYCLVPFPIFVGMWLIFVNLLNPAYLKLQPASFTFFVSTLQALIVPLVAIDFLGFFYPPISIHNSMLRAKSRLSIRLDVISQQINAIHAHLLSNAPNLDPKEGTALEEKIDFLKRVYGRFMPVPTWPYRGGHLLSLTSSQIIPIIGMLSSIAGFFRMVFMK